MMSTNNLTTGLLFIIGAGAGAVATYLLDPDRGEARRAAISKTAGDALDHAGNIAGQTVSQVRDTSRQAGRQLSALVSDTSESATRTGSEWLRQGRTRAARTGSSLREWFGHEQPTPLERAAHLAAPAIVGSTTGAALLGLGLYYFLGSSNAARNRQKLAEKVHFAARETGEMGRRTGSYLRDRLAGSQHNDPITNPSGSTARPTLPIAPSEQGNTAYVGDALESGEPTLTGQPRPIMQATAFRAGVSPVL